jgi:hypothetical protein
MSGANAPAARLRGGFIGALAASSTFAAHGLAGGPIPSGGAIALLILACTALGATAATASRASIVATAAMLAAGQSMGHLLLLAAGHHHGPVLTGPMLAAHGSAALAGAVLVVLAERLCRSIASVHQWLGLLVTGVRPTAESCGVVSALPRPHIPRPRDVTATVTSRGPPRLAHS